MNAAQGGFAIVIPAYQERATIAGIIEAVRATMPDAALLVVDDGSTDGTGDIAEAAGAHVLRPGANAGKGAALRIGMRAAMAEGAAWVLTMVFVALYAAMFNPKK